jgi:cytidylate kinase
MSDAAAAAGSSCAGGHGKGSGVPRVVTIDGPAAAGKSTVGRMIAERLGYPFLDTGAIYRAATWAALHHGVDLEDDEALSELAASISLDVGPPTEDSIEPCTIFVDGEDVTAHLRAPEVEAAVSLVSRVAGVRKALVKVQRDLAGRNAVVMAGRDIGTVVLPDADLKLYLDASVEERARRRYAELSRLGHDVTEAGVLQDLRRRDRIDSERAVSPLRPADDAITVETDGLSLEQVVAKVAELVEASR